MKNCTHCFYAEWKRTKSGGLHPGGEGLCTYEMRIPKLPAAMYWTGSPRISGGFINRRKELREHCVYYTSSPTTARPRSSGRGGEE